MSQKISVQTRVSPEVYQIIAKLATETDNSISKTIYRILEHSLIVEGLLDETKQEND